MKQLKVQIVIGMLLLACSSASLQAQDFKLKTEPRERIWYDSLRGMYGSSIYAEPPGSDSIWYYVDVPDSIQQAPIVTVQLNGPSTFRILRWVTNDSIASLPLNTPFQMQTVRLFATSFFVAWDAHVGLDSAFLTVSDNTDTVMVRIMGGYHLPLPDLPITPYPEESDFDSVLVGTTICKEYHIHNASGGNITVTNFRIDGIFTPTGGSPHKETHFSIDASSPLPYTMLNNDSMSFTICYSPQAAGIDDDSLWIMNEDTLLGGVRFIGSSIAGSGVQRIADVDHVIIFPNPVRSHLYTSGIPEDGSYTIIDAIGREVIRETSHSNVIDVSNCHSGLYTIIFSSGRRANFIKLDP